MARAHWENAYWADMTGAVSASEAAFQLLAGGRSLHPSTMSHQTPHVPCAWLGMHGAQIRTSTFYGIDWPCPVIQLTPGAKSPALP